MGNIYKGLLMIISVSFFLFYSVQSKSTNSIESSQWLALNTEVVNSSVEASEGLAHYHLEKGNKLNAIAWYKQAMRLGSHSARIQLATFAITDHNLEQATKLLKPISENDKAFLLLYQLAINLGDELFIAEHFKRLQRLSQENKPDFIELNQAVKRYRIFPKKHVTSENVSYSVVASLNKNQQGCTNHMQFFASSLQQLSGLENIIKKLEGTFFSQYMCFKPPRYIVKNILNCSSEAAIAITCDESIWAKIDIEDNVKYLGVLTEKGGANVHNGIMYIDNDDDFFVVRHELAHVLGFVDEYMLSDHMRCKMAQSTAFAHNIAILPKTFIGKEDDVKSAIKQQIPWFNYIEKDIELIPKGINKWQIKLSSQNPSKNIGIYAANICKNSNILAVKPINQRTALMYFELDFPKLYRQLLGDNPSEFLMPSYHYNIAKALSFDASDTEVMYWLNRAILFENDNSPRITRIKRGEY